MKKLSVALALFALPVTASPLLPVSAYAATMTELGDLTPLQTIVTDTQALIAKGDIVDAQKRITDFETAWDKDAGRLRSQSIDKWGFIDDAADKAIGALRAGTPVAADAGAAVAGLAAAIDNPVAGAAAPAAAAPAAAAGAIITTDANGRPLPCENMLAQVRAATPSATADKAKADELTNKGIERCNADDDKRSDDFFGQALGMLSK